MKLIRSDVLKRDYLFWANQEHYKNGEDKERLIDVVIECQPEIDTDTKRCGSCQHYKKATERLGKCPYIVCPIPNDFYCKWHEPRDLRI